MFLLYAAIGVQLLTRKRVAIEASPETGEPRELDELLGAHNAVKPKLRLAAERVAEGSNSLDFNFDALSLGDKANAGWRTRKDHIARKQSERS